MKVLAKIGRALLTLAASTLVLLVLWVGFLKVFGINSFVGKGPGDVYRYLFTVDGASGNRSVLVHALRTTLWDALLGFVVGGCASVAVAVAFVLWKPLERSLLPIAMVLRSVPIVAMVPLLALAFGRGTLGTIVIVGIVVFFPTLVLVTNGLRSVTKEAIEVMAAYDASDTTTLRKVRLPGALPSVFAAARVAAPGAILGALLCEWFLTGKGLGYLLLSAGTQTKYNLVWAATVLLTVVSILLYTLVTTIERVVLDRYAPQAAR